MAYLLEPINKPYDPEEPMPTPLGFVAKWQFFKGANDLKRTFTPIPPALVYQTVDVDGDRPMPDFFSLAADNYYVSSRFRAVLEEYARDAVEYIEVAFRIPAHKNPADAYYFINVLGRGQLIDWEATRKQGPRRGRDNKQFYVLAGTPDQWIMRAPTRDHPAIWHEIHRDMDNSVYLGSGTRVFVTNELGNALDAAFSGQLRLAHIRETQTAI